MAEKKTIWLFLIFGVFVLAAGVWGYAYYVRGVFSQPRIETPQTVDINRSVEFSWEVLPDMPTARTEVVAAELHGSIYVIGGLDGFGRTTNAVEVWNTHTRTWRSVDGLPQPRHHAMAVSDGQTIYVVGGYTGINFTPHPEVFSFDPREAVWREVSPLPVPLAAGGAAISNGKIYVAGGVSSDGLSDRLFVYDIAEDTWEEKVSMPSVSMPTARDHLAAAATSEKFYVAGGRELSLDKNLSLLEIYNIEDDRWGRANPMPTARGGVAGAILQDMFVVVGGEEPRSTFGSVEAYLIERAGWISLPDLPTPRHGLSAVAVGDELYVIGGGKNPGLSVSGANEVLKMRR